MEKGIQIIYRTEEFKIAINHASQVLLFVSAGGIVLRLPIDTYNILHNVITDAVKAERRKTRRM